MRRIKLASLTNVTRSRFPSFPFKVFTATETVEPLCNSKSPRKTSPGNRFSKKNRQQKRTKIAFSKFFFESDAEKRVFVRSRYRKRLTDHEEYTKPDD